MDSVLTGISLFFYSVPSFCLALALILFLTLAVFKTHFAAYQVAAHCLLLLTATIFWIRERSKYSTFIYVMLGYMALSAAIVSASTSPEYFVWLSWQSILVVSTAVWFRSRFIVVANFFIYLMLFAAYIILGGKIGLITLAGPVLEPMEELCLLFPGNF